FNANPFLSILTTYLNYNDLLLNIVHYYKQENLEHFLKMSKMTLPIWLQYKKKGVELSISEISQREKNIKISDRIREIY
ncbi:hypothetical protein ACJBSK_11135, partial [Streptococcus suis]